MESNIRQLVKRYMDGFQWESGLFWADIMMSLSSGNIDDILSHLRCLIELGQHLRALSLLEHRNLLKSHKVFQYIGARCLYVGRRYDDVIQLIEEPISSTVAPTTVATTTNRDDISGAFNAACRLAATITLTNDDLNLLTNYSNEWKIDAGLFLLLGKAYEKLENRQQAANAYKQCLILDTYCVEAFERLIRRHMLTEQDERDLLNRLFDGEQRENRSNLLSKVTEYLYKSKAVKNSFTNIGGGGQTNDGDDQGEIIDQETKRKLSTNLSVMADQAEHIYYQSNYRDSYKLTTKILMDEEFHSDVLNLHVANLVALSKTTELFTLAHKLIEAFPDALISWYAVACYYYSIENYEAAKRFFHKCTLLDAHHGASWIGYGHSFAVEQEHDQAMNCYVKAAKIMSTCQLPLMYVGLEYSLTNNLRLAEKFFLHASQMSPDDPYVLHELGVLFYRLDNSSKAEEYFRRAEKIVGLRSAWEELLNNTGHVMRKLKKYDESLEYHRRALRLAPNNASTLAAIGYLHMFLEQFDVAVEFFHQSLSLKREDGFVTNLLTKAMDVLSETWRAPYPEPPVLTVPTGGSKSKKPTVEISIIGGEGDQSDVDMELT